MPLDPSPFEALDFRRPTGMRLRELESGRSDEGGRRFEVLCAVRRKWVRLEPEEWVRQHLVAHLVVLGWPLGRTSVEYPAQFGQAQGRIDVAVLDPQGQPALIAECKAPGVALSQATLDQLGRYQLDAGAPFAIATNGRQHMVWHNGQPIRHFPSPA